MERVNKGKSVTVDTKEGRPYNGLLWFEKLTRFLRD